MSDTTTQQKAPMEPLWTKDFLLAAVLRFFISIPFSLLTATLTLFAYDQYNTDAYGAGVIVGAFMVGALVSRLGLSGLTDVIGRRRILVVSTAILFALSFLYFIPMDMSLFIALRFVFGLSFGIATNTSTVIGTALIPRSRYSEGVNVFTLGAVAAAALGPFVGLLIVQYLSFFAVFVVNTTACACAFICCLVIKIADLDLTEEKKQEIIANVKRFQLLDVKAIPFAINGCLASLCSAGVTAFIAVYAMEFDCGPYTSFYFVAYTIVVFIGRPITGRLMDSRGHNTAIIPSFLCFAVSFVVFCLLQNVVGLLITGALMGLGYGCLISSLQAVVYSHTPQERMGMAASTFFIFADGGQGFGPAILGALVPFFGYRGMFGICIIVVLASLAFYFLHYGRKPEAWKPASH